MANELSFALTVPAELNPGGVVVRMAGTNERPLFCLADVCKVLDLSTPGKVAERLDEDEKGVSLIHTPGGPQEMTFITEAGFYSVVLRSDKPQAKPFRKWVCGEVLPCIRQHGCYPAPSQASSPPSVLDTLREMIRQEVRAIVPASPPVERRVDRINPYEFVYRCWPGCPTRIAQQIVRRMAHNYEKMLYRLAPQAGTSATAPLECDREHLYCLTLAFEYYWQKEHPDDCADSLPFPGSRAAQKQQPKDN